MKLMVDVARAILSRVPNGTREEKLVNLTVLVVALPKKCPDGWTRLPSAHLDSPLGDHRAFRRGRLQVLVSVAPEGNDGWEYHVSITTPGRRPTPEEIQQVTRDFFAPAADVVEAEPGGPRLNPLCVHLYAYLRVKIPEHVWRELRAYSDRLPAPDATAPAPFRRRSVRPVN